MAPTTMAMMVGLSPRVRGNRFNRVIQRLPSRSIPACAGEPSRWTLRVGRFRVYPRVCGGTAILTLRVKGDEGLSPRVRGNHEGRVDVTYTRRSIPACAGEPADYQDYCFAHSVYPRVCGGTPANSPPVCPVIGLSPRVRGNHGQRGYHGPNAGSIPACAGEPMAAPFRTCAKEVYPRVCGGTGKHQYGRLYAQGLSPRVRGNRFQNAAIPNNSGSIPACAGEPFSERGDPEQQRAYPRVCGGTVFRTRRSRTTAGLSPRVRGNQDRHYEATIGVRSIPACAGEPNPAMMESISERVYPRVCGGTAMPLTWRVDHEGLSPRVRGNLVLLLPSSSPGRSIPACAGEPFP